MRGVCQGIFLKPILGALKMTALAQGNLTDCTIFNKLEPGSSNLLLIIFAILKTSGSWQASRLDK